MHRVYLDNAATGWPKPEPVYLTADQFLRNVSAAARRGGQSDDGGNSHGATIARFGPITATAPAPS
jgi:hypothetical protein